MTRSTIAPRYAEITRDEVPAGSFRYMQAASNDDFDVPADNYAVCTIAAREEADGRTFTDVLVAHFLFSKEEDARQTAASLAREGAQNGAITLVHPKGVYLSIPYFFVRFVNSRTGETRETAVMSEAHATEYAEALIARDVQGVEVVEVGRR